MKSQSEVATRTATGRSIVQSRLVRQQTLKQSLMDSGHPRSEVAENHPRSRRSTNTSKSFLTRLRKLRKRPSCLQKRRVNTKPIHDRFLTRDSKHSTQSISNLEINRLREPKLFTSRFAHIPNHVHIDLLPHDAPHELMARSTA